MPPRTLHNSDVRQGGAVAGVIPDGQSEHVAAPRQGGGVGHWLGSVRDLSGGWSAEMESGRQIFTRSNDVIGVDMVLDDIRRV